MELDSSGRLIEGSVDFLTRFKNPDQDTEIAPIEMLDTPAPESQLEAPESELEAPESELETPKGEPETLPTPDGIPTPSGVGTIIRESVDEGEVVTISDQLSPQIESDVSRSEIERAPPSDQNAPEPIPTEVVAFVDPEEDSNADEASVSAPRRLRPADALEASR